MTIDAMLDRVAKMQLATLLPRGVKAKDFLGMVMRGEITATPQQMSAARELLTVEEPKLQAVGIGKLYGEDFYTRLDKAVEASERAKVVRMIEGRAEQVDDPDD